MKIAFSSALLSPEAREVRAKEYPGTGARKAFADAARATTETNAVRTIVLGGLMCEGKKKTPAAMRGDSNGKGRNGRKGGVGGWVASRNAKRFWFTHEHYQMYVS